MKTTSVRKLAADGGCSLYGDTSVQVCGVKIDSRICEPGYLFIAVKGENFDGHDYLENAYSNGCRAYLVSEESKGLALLEKHPDAALMVCEDVTPSFEHMAAAYLGQFPDLKKVAVTGSVGKTTTKALVTAVLAEKYSVVC